MFFLVLYSHHDHFVVFTHLGATDQFLDTIRQVEFIVAGRPLFVTNAERPADVTIAEWESSRHAVAALFARKTDNGDPAGRRRTPLRTHGLEERTTSAWSDL